MPGHSWPPRGRGGGAVPLPRTSWKSGIIISDSCIYVLLATPTFSYMSTIYGNVHVGIIGIIRYCKVL